jgi:hypothetical protein
VGQPWKSLDDRTREYLLGRAKSDTDREAIPLRLGLSRRARGASSSSARSTWARARAACFVEGKTRGWHEGGPRGFKRFEGDERELLEEFWRTLGRARRIVTFNGRAFDGPTSCCARRCWAWRPR